MSCSPASGYAFYVGSTTVPCTATDDSGNTIPTTFQVAVINYHGGSGPDNSTINTTGDPRQWDPHEDAEYKVIFANKFTDYTHDTSYQFVNLEH